jgi:hypothetical protein
MNNFLGNPAAAGPREFPLPDNVPEEITQPTDPILNYCWIISKTTNNCTYLCKLCGIRFTGSGISNVGSHYNKKFTSQRVTFCKG